MEDYKFDESSEKYNFKLFVGQTIEKINSTVFIY